MKKSCSGFTLIELLIVMTIITLLFSIGIVQYNQFNRRQILVKAKDELISNLRLAQGKSLAGEKPVNCLTEILEGFKLSFINNQNYKIVAVCNGEFDVKTSLALPMGVTKQGDPTQAVFFRVLSQGSPGNTTIILQGFGETKTITVTAAGEIK